MSKSHFGNVKVELPQISFHRGLPQLACHRSEIGAKRIFDSFLILAIYFGCTLALAHVSLLFPKICTILRKLNSTLQPARSCRGAPGSLAPAVIPRFVLISQPLLVPLASMVDQVVLTAFKRFDQDGSGFISHEELGKVLQSLDPDDWDNDRVDELMATADASGDGKLQITEFLQWIFAEDPRAIGLGLGRVAEYTFIISGCSRESINGRYVQQGKFCNHRPIFYCSANKLVLFYWKEREQWQINKRPGSKSCTPPDPRGAPHGWRLAGVEEKAT